MPFMNPYNFVRFQPMADNARQKPLSHRAGQGLSGRLTCHIFPLSPIFIPTQDFNDPEAYEEVNLPRDHRGNHRDPHRCYLKFYNPGDGIPTIPGSSLKGAIRSVAEALCNGCLSEFFGTKDDLLYESLMPCTDPQALCPTCRLFGMPSAEGEGEDNLFFKAKVSFNSARLIGTAQYLPEPVLLPELSEPKPNCDIFYRKAGKLIGRKFYYHRDQLDIMPGDSRDKNALQRFIKNQNNLPPNSRDGLHRSRSVRPLKEGCEFEFTVEYNNLAPEELALLVYSLELEPIQKVIKEKPKFVRGVYHKLGYGKPAGLGSAAIRIQKWKKLDLKSRYSEEPQSTGWSDPVGDLRRDLSLLKLSHISYLGGTYRSYKGHPVIEGAQNIQDLCSILRWPNGIPEIRYPNRDEFDTPLPEPGKEPQKN